MVEDWSSQESNTLHLVLNSLYYDIVNSSDIVVIPSLWENYPNVCLEAMSLGKCILASNQGGMSEMLDGIESALFSPTIENHLYIKLSPLIMSEHLRNSIAKNINERFKVFNQTQNQKVREFYSDLLDT